MISNTCSSVAVACGEVPHPKTLCCVEVSVNPPESPSPQKPVFHLRTSTCRQIIFDNSEIIASPHWETSTVIYIIMSKQDFKQEKIMDMAKKMNFSVMDPSEPSDEIFESCLLYTVCAKCSPLWNQVENYLFYGTSFLWSDFRAPAVRLDTSIGKDEAYLIVKSLAVAIEGIKLEDLGIPEEECEAFHNNDTYIIEQKHIKSPGVYLLPMYTRGRVISVSREFPDESTYGTLLTLCRHWRETYGYVLSDHDRKVDYYTVTYSVYDIEVTEVFPAYCVRTCHMTFPRDIYPYITLDMFDAVMSDDFPTLCGLPFVLRGKLLGRLPKLSKDLSVTVSSSSDSSSDLDSEEDDDSD